MKKVRSLTHPKHLSIDGITCTFTLGYCMSFIFIPISKRNDRSIPH